MEKYLKPKIALIAPSDKSNSFEEEVNKIKALGFNPVYLEGTTSDEFPYPGTKIAHTAEQRARQIINLAQDSDIVAMWAINGGASAQEVSKLLVEYGKNPEQYIADHQTDPLSKEKLEYHPDAKNGFPKDRPLPPVIGMSDVSNIQIALARFGFPSYYGTTVGFMKEEQMKSMVDLIKNKDQRSEFSGIKSLSNVEVEKIEGPVYTTVCGGLGSSLNTNWQFQALPGTILMLEDVEGYESLTKELIRAEKAGALKNVQAIIIGNANPNLNEKDYVPKELEALATNEDFKNIHILFVNNQIGHIFVKDTIPTPVANFGKMTIDLENETAVIDKTGSQDAARDYGNQYQELKSHNQNKLSEEDEKVIYPKLTNLPIIELFPLNQKANNENEQTEFKNVIGGDSEKIRLSVNYPELKEKTLLISWGSFGLGRELLDLYNKKILNGVDRIIVGVNNRYNELKSKLENPDIEERDKVAIGLSLMTHPLFSFTAGEAGSNTYFCEFTDPQFEHDIKAVGGYQNFAEDRAAQFKWNLENANMTAGIKITAEDGKVKIEINNEGYNQSIIDKTKNLLNPNSPESAKMQSQQKRVEYFIKRHINADKNGKNQAGDDLYEFCGKEIPVYLTDINKLPDEVRKGQFFSDELKVKIEKPKSQISSFSFEILGKSKDKEMIK